METLTGLLKKGQEILAQAGIEEAGLDARLLLEYITGKSRAYYLAHGEECVTKETADRYLELVTGRSQHIPLQHLTHQAFFMGYEFYVNEDVLIPRQDTETLVEEALRLLKGRQKPRVLDMCTGSGCILTSLLLEVPDVKSDLFSSEYFSGPVYDMLISNPPYIPTGEIEGLMEEVRLHDPRMALDGKADGLYFYRAITKQAMDYILPGGWLLYEIGWDQGKAVKELLDREGFINTEIKRDLCGLDRVVLGQKSLQEEQNV